MDTCWNLGLKHQKNSVGFHKDAGDTEYKADSKGGLP